MPYRRRRRGGDGGGGGGAELGVLLKTVCGVASSPPRCQAKKNLDGIKLERFFLWEIVVGGGFERVAWMEPVQI